MFSSFFFRSDRFFPVSRNMVAKYENSEREIYEKNAVYRKCSRNRISSGVYLNFRTTTMDKKNYSVYSTMHGGYLCCLSIFPSEFSLQISFNNAIPFDEKKIDFFPIISTFFSNVYSFLRRISIDIPLIS